MAGTLELDDLKRFLPAQTILWFSTTEDIILQEIKTDGNKNCKNIHKVNFEINKHYPKWNLALFKNKIWVFLMAKLDFQWNLCEVSQHSTDAFQGPFSPCDKMINPFLFNHSNNNIFKVMLFINLGKI